MPKKPSQDEILATYDALDHDDIPCERLIQMVVETLGWRVSHEDVVDALELHAAREG